MPCSMTFEHFEEIYKTAKDAGYEIITLEDFFSDNYNTDSKILVNRIDVDFNCERARTMAEILNQLNIKGSFYFRLHAKEYNLFAFENVNILKEIASAGHEIGLHSEIIDYEKICLEDAALVLKKEIKLFEDYFEIKISGTASHGDFTGFNNLDFWKKHNAKEFGLLYEAYDSKLWDNSIYVSDSLIKGWKSYSNGILNAGDNRCACEVINDNHKVIYLLTHPFCFYRRHFHE